MTDTTRADASFGLLGGICFVALAGCLLATQDAIVKDMTARLSPLQISVIRFGLHGLYVVAFLRATSKVNLLKTRQPRLHFARAACLLGSSLGMHISLTELPLSQATVLQFLSPLVVLLLSAIFLKEKIGLMRVGILLAGFAGVALVIGPEIGGSYSAIWLLPVLSAVFSAGYVLLTRRLSDPSEAVAALALLPIICVVLLIPAQPFVWSAIALPDLWLILVLSLTGTAAHVFIQLGMRSAPASVLTPFLYSQVLFAGVLGAAFFSDPLGPRFSIGASLIIAAGLAIWGTERLRQNGAS